MLSKILKQNSTVCCNKSQSNFFFHSFFFLAVFHRLCRTHVFSGVLELFFGNYDACCSAPGRMSVQPFSVKILWFLWHQPSSPPDGCDVHEQEVQIGQEEACF